jgi:PTH1 family peptidyl-tRNA hydrolase
MLLLCLGNPGVLYMYNRHNAGALFADWLICRNPRRKETSWRKDPTSPYFVARYSPQVCIAKPIAFMNESGCDLQKLLNKMGIHLNELWVVHDDLDVRFGKWKLSFSRGPKLHGGLNSICYHLKTDKFWRVRIGVDNRPTTQRIPGEEYVLQDFAKQEYEQLPGIFEGVWDNIRRRSGVI